MWLIVNSIIPSLEIAGIRPTVDIGNGDGLEPIGSGLGQILTEVSP